ncbi:MAG: DNA polymerase III subunit delta' [Pseudomonadales bacterium]|nr:DNA polymerase III subunit delta' [Pseudomonadales bacterium]
MQEPAPVSNQILPWQGPLWSALSQRFLAGTLAHAHLLHGEQGSGKLDFARQLAGMMLCQQPVQATVTGLISACFNCRSCHLFAAGNHPDLLLITPEEGSNAIKVEQIRKLIEFTQRTAHGTKGRVILVYPAEAMATAPANALLKILEEPPQDTYFLLSSHQPGRLLATVRSRCQSQLMPIPDRATLGAWLQEELPEIESDQIDTVIDLTGGKPLQCLHALQSGLPAYQQELLDTLYTLTHSRGLATELAKKYEKTDREKLLRLLMRNVALLINEQLSGQTVAGQSKDFRKLADRVLVSGADNRPARQLLNLYRRLQAQLTQLTSGNNPNPLLALEEIFLAWQAVVGTIHKRNPGNI